MSKADEMERTAAFRASAQFPAPARLAAGRNRLLAAAVAEHGHAEGARPARLRRAGPHPLAGRGGMAAARAAVRQRWLRPALAGGLTAAAAASAAAAMVLTSGPATAPGSHATAGHARTVVTAAWTVRQGADGTVTVQVRQYLDPAGLQRTLRADGVNAIIRSFAAFCLHAPSNVAPRAVQQAVVGNGDDPVDYVIHPDAMPSGSALFLTFSTFTSPRRPGYVGIGAAPPIVLTTDTAPPCTPTPPPGAPLSGMALIIPGR